MRSLTFRYTSSTEVSLASAERVMRRSIKMSTSWKLTYMPS